MELSADDFEKNFRKTCPVNFTKREKLACLPEPDAPKTRIEFSGEAQTFATKSGTRLFVPLFPQFAWKNPLPATEKRQQPLVMRDAYFEIHSCVLEVPEGFQVEALPKNTDLQGVFGSMKTSFKFENEFLVCTRRLTILPVNLPAQKYGETCDFFKKKMESTDGAKAVLVAKKT